MFKKDLRWNIYIEENNKIISKNIFEFEQFYKSLRDVLKRVNTKNNFEIELDAICLYHFFGRSEYEIGITSWPVFIDKNELNDLSNLAKKRDYKRFPINLSLYKKVSIYDQLKTNWTAFINYIWTTFKSEKGE